MRGRHLRAAAHKSESIDFDLTTATPWVAEKHLPPAKGQRGTRATSFLAREPRPKHEGRHRSLDSAKLHLMERLAR